MQCVADYALTALPRNDSEVVNLACSVLLARVPIGVTTSESTINTRKAWMHSLSRILEVLLHPRSTPHLTHVSRRNWRSGFPATSRFNETIGGAEEDLVLLLEAGITAGLVLYNTTEEAALNELRARYTS